ncbi:MAG: ribosomal protein S18-alanine N-acetyltransferase [Thermodesulfovibrionales bacterium]|nr:ribosomal protein S18-alanine N-acetyltransferase [Thermodesulfovibrionales bacterium]
MLPDDVSEVVKIERLSFSTPWSETSFYSEIYSDHSITRIAETNGTIAGYICVKRMADECHLLNLAVRPDYRNQGIATTLLNNVIQELNKWGCRALFLEVRASNYAAMRLYAGFGFKTIGVRKNYYLYPAEDAVVMMLEL